jgi:hypothetical protein
MSLFIRVAFVLVILTAPYYLGVSATGAATLWYNGDLEGVSCPDNYGQNPSTYSYVYDDFVVPEGVTWNVTSVWSNNGQGSYTTAVGAAYDIRQGVSAGNAGILVASGWDESGVRSPTGRSMGTIPEYQITVDVSGVILTPGRYWLRVTPHNWGDNPTYSYISDTIGTNAVGNPPGNSGKAYLTDSYGNYFLAIAGDYSMGLAGDVNQVPLPASLPLLGSGLLGLLGLGRKFRRS